MNKQTIINDVEQYKLIAILRGIPSEKLLQVAQALYDGGIRMLEVTYSANGAVPDEETAANIGRLAEHFAGRMHIGAGTVLTTKQVRLTKEAGGTFIISPNVKREVIEETVKLGLVSMPGVFTPSEACDAVDFGADFVKLFPVTNMGSSYVKAIKAPLSHIKFLAVGGIDETNMQEYLDAGVSGFGIGSNITNKKMIDNNDFVGLTALAKKYTEVICHG